MATLSVPQKRFIVERLACFETPSQAAASFKEFYGQEITRMRVQQHDPTKAAGANLSKDLTDLFHSTRQRFRETVEDIPIANQSYRLASLNQMHAQALSKGNFVLASQILEQGAKEIGGAYTNTRKLEGGNPKNPIAVAAITASADGLSGNDLASLYKTMMG